MTGGLVITAVRENSTPWAESPKLGQVQLPTAAVERLLGSVGQEMAEHALDFGNFGGQFSQVSLRALASSAIAASAEDERTIGEMRALSDLGSGKGIVSIRPLRAA